MGKFDLMDSINKDSFLSACRQREMTVPKIAKAIRVSPTTIYKYLNKGQIPRALMDRLCDVLFHNNDEPKEDPEPVFPIYTKDLIRAKLYLTRALNKMDEIYLRQGGQKI